MNESTLTYRMIADYISGISLYISYTYAYFFQGPIIFVRTPANVSAENRQANASGEQFTSASCTDGSMTSAPSAEFIGSLFTTAALENWAFLAPDQLRIAFHGATAGMTRHSAHLPRVYLSQIANLAVSVGATAHARALDRRVEREKAAAPGGRQSRQCGRSASGVSSRRRGTEPSGGSESSSAP